MKTFSSLKQNKIAFSLSIIVAVFFVVSVASAVTTISTAISTAGDITTTAGNIEATAGTLTVGGASTLTGNTAVTGTLTVTAKTTVGNASTTLLSVGSNGTTLSKLMKGTCYLTNYGTSGSGIDASQAASSTVLYQCAATNGANTAITGLVSGDLTIVQFATTTAEVLNGWVIVSSSASTTNGYINVLVSNLTGTAAVPSMVGVGSSTSYIIMR